MCLCAAGAADGGVFGNLVEERTGRTTSSADKMWLVPGVALPPGQLINFRVYIHAGSAGDAATSSLKSVRRQNSYSFNTHF